MYVDADSSSSSTPYFAFLIQISNVDNINKVKTHAQEIFFNIYEINNSSNNNYNSSKSEEGWAEKKQGEEEFRAILYWKRCFE